MAKVKSSIRIVGGSADGKFRRREILDRGGTPSVRWNGRWYQVHERIAAGVSERFIIIGTGVRV